MKKGAKKLIGKKDFSTFRASNCSAKSPIRTINKIIIMTPHILARPIILRLRAIVLTACRPAVCLIPRQFLVSIQLDLIFAMINCFAKRKTYLLQVKLAFGPIEENHIPDNRHFYVRGL